MIIQDQCKLPNKQVYLGQDKAKPSKPQHTPLFVLDSLSAHSYLASPPKTALVSSSDTAALSAEHPAGFAMPILRALPC